MTDHAVSNKGRLLVSGVVSIYTYSKLYLHRPGDEIFIYMYIYINILLYVRAADEADWNKFVYKAAVTLTWSRPN